MRRAAVRGEAVRRVWCATALGEDDQRRGSGPGGSALFDAWRVDPDGSVPRSSAEVAGVVKRFPLPCFLRDIPGSATAAAVIGMIDKILGHIAFLQPRRAAWG